MTGRGHHSFIKTSAPCPGDGIGISVHYTRFSASCKRFPAKRDDNAFFQLLPGRFRFKRERILAAKVRMRRNEYS